MKKHQKIICHRLSSSDLTLFNDMNNEYNARNVDNIDEYNHAIFKQDEMNSGLGERGMMPGSSVYSGRNGNYKM